MKLGSKNMDRNKLGNKLINGGYQMGLGTKMTRRGNYSDLDQQIIEENKESQKHQSNLEKFHKKLSDVHNQGSTMTLHKK